MLLAAASLIVVAGAAIGATGIGGILVVPALTSLAGVGPTEAIAASSFAFLFTGLAALWRQRTQPAGVAPSGDSMAWLCGAACLGAGLGAALAHLLPAQALRGGVALLALLSGAHALFAASLRGGVSRALPGTGALVALGVLVGTGSALSGTGGPVLLLPALLFIGVPIRQSVLAAQGVQLPVALAATGVHLLNGRLDLRLGLLLALALMGGWWLGTWAADRLPTHALRRGVALGLVGTGLWYGLPGL